MTMTAISCSMVISLFLWTVFASSTGANIGPKENLVDFEGHVRYERVDTKMSWYDARDHCVRAGGLLAMAENKAEFDEIKRVAHKRSVWIGLHFSGNGSVGQKGSWVDECGKVPNYDGWLSGAPRNDRRARCAYQMRDGQWHGYWGKWENDACENYFRDFVQIFVSKRFVCQFGKRC